MAGLHEWVVQPLGGGGGGGGERVVNHYYTHYDQVRSILLHYTWVIVIGNQITRKANSKSSGKFSLHLSPKLKNKQSNPRKH